MLQVNVTVMPTSATFPEVDVNEQYNCHFTANAQNYSFTLPFVNGEYCDPTVTPIPEFDFEQIRELLRTCLLYTSPSPRDATLSRMPSSA